MLCPQCGTDLTMYTKKRKSTHMKKCNPSLEKRVSEEEIDEILCGLCDKNLTRVVQKEAISHVKLCAKIHKTSSSDLSNVLETVKSQYKRLRKKKPDLEDIFEDYKYEAVSDTPPPDTSTVEGWLLSIGMERYFDTFIRNGFDTIQVCCELTREDLEDGMGIELAGHVKKLEMGSKSLKKHVQKQQVAKKLLIPAPKKREIVQKPAPKKKKRVIDDLDLNDRQNTQQIVSGVLDNLSNQNDSSSQDGFLATQQIPESIFTRGKKLFDFSGIDEVEFENELEKAMEKINEMEDRYSSQKNSEKSSSVEKVVIPGESDAWSIGVEEMEDVKMLTRRDEPSQSQRLDIMTEDHPKSSVFVLDESIVEVNEISHLAQQFTCDTRDITIDISETPVKPSAERECLDYREGKGSPEEQNNFHQPEEDHSGFQTVYNERCHLLMSQFKFQMEGIYQGFLDQLQVLKEETQTKLRGGEFLMEYIPPLLGEVVNPQLFFSPNSKNVEMDHEEEYDAPADLERKSSPKRLFDDSQDIPIRKKRKTKQGSKKNKVAQSQVDPPPESTSEIIPEITIESLSQRERPISYSQMELPEGCPKYSECHEVDLKRTLTQFGLKGGSKKYMVERLIQIWVETHK